MIKIENFETRSAEFVLRMLRLGQPVESTVPKDTRDDSGGDGPTTGNIHLFPRDRTCSECGEELDEYGPDADFVEIAARIKAKYGRTLCSTCHDDIAS